MKKLTYEDFLSKARQVHGYKYEYPNLEQNFVNMTTPIPIICHQKDENGIKHGEFKQNPSKHLEGHGCKKCAKQKNGLNKTSVSEKNFHELSEEKFGERFGIKSKYVNAKHKIQFLCNKHNYLYDCLPSVHLRSKTGGCPVCAMEERKKTRQLTSDILLSFHEAKNFIKSFLLNTQKDYLSIYDKELKSKGLPKYPETSYKNEWKGWNDFLSCNKHTNTTKFLDYDSAQKYASSLGLKSQKEWIEYTKSKEFNNDIPKYPGAVYKNKGWISWGSWLGTGFVNNADKVFLSYFDAKELVQKFQIKTVQEYADFTKKEEFPKKLPKQPQHYYKKEWVSWMDFLGNNRLYFTKSYVLSIIKEIDLEAMTDHQLIELISMKKLPQELKALSFTPAGSDERKNTIEHLKSVLEDSTTTDEETKEVIDKEIEELEKKKEQKSKNKNISTVNNDNGEEELSEVNNTLPELALRQLHIYDDPRLTPSGDGERFIKQESIQILWNNTLKDEYKFINMLENEKGGEFFNAIRNEFLKEYEEVKNITVDENYKFQYLPNLMQKLMVYRIQSNPYYGNWCGTGAGKTIAMLLSSRKIGSKVTLCIAPNAVVDTMEKSIRETYPDSKILTPNKPSDIIELDGNCHSYIIVNYEKFQLANASEWINNLVNKNRIDFICLDEVQNAKVRNTENAPLRYNNIALLRKLAFDKNPNLKVLAMSATPIINNLQEVRSIMELITGKEYDEIKNKTSLSNVHEAYKALLMNGFRYIPKYDISINTEFVQIDGNDISDKLVNVKDNSIADVEKILAKKKIDGILKIGIINKGTLVYTQYVTGIVKTLKKSIASMGFKVDTYTGEESEDIRREIIERFIKGDTDVLVASKPITTGVDGLQKCCNRMIMISLPWTNSDYVQLVGRIYRQGSLYKNVDIYIPQIIVNTSKSDWSWDKRRMSVIDTKKTLGEAVMDGNLQDVYNNEGFRTHLISMAIKSLKKGLEDTVKERKDIEPNFPAEISNKEDYEIRESLTSDFNRRGKTTSSENMHKYLKQHPEDWFEYHKARSENMKSWNEIPYEYIAKLIKNKRSIVADFGCGENKMKELIPNTVYSFDHVAIDESVIACDMAHTPLEDETIDIAVFSLALWGTNFTDYFKEAYRVLNYDGLIHIAEPTKSYTEDKKSELIAILKNYGFTLVGNIDNRGKFFYLTAIKK